MEGSEGSPPPSLCVIRAAELFPKYSMEKEDDQLTVPFQELAGESVKYLGRTTDGVLALSNYRIFLQKNPINSETSVPLGLIESAQSRDFIQLIINCKDASTVKCSFQTPEQCSEWQRRIQLSVGVPESLESLFAFPFYSWTADLSSAAAAASQSQHNFFTGCADNFADFNSGRLQRAARHDDDFDREVERLQFNLNGVWRISYANRDFKLCPSYPHKILVPLCITDETLENVAKFRGSRRLPAIVWRHKKSGAVLARCSQPEVGWLGWRNSNDEQLLKALADACAFDRGEQNRRMNLCQSVSGESSPSSPEGSHEEVNFEEVRKILIVDARSYTSAVTNRARGGGCECIEYYPCAEIEFMNLGNIHVIRKSFHSLRQLCAQPPDFQNWLGSLEKTLWLNHLSGLLAASVTVCHAIEKKGRPVLVHCSDGWDRTPQIVATAQLCLDPFYRTVEGFRILIEREWLQFGHKFADRCGHGPGSDETNERCPVFLQWLDLVHQIHRQFPCSFEFSMGFLIKLAQHSHSCLFGTFLCNTLREREKNSVYERTFSVWPFLSGPMYRNPLYIRNKEKVLWPAHNVRDLNLWTEVYLGSLGNQNVADFPPGSSDTNMESTNPLTKTRSYGDLITAGVNQNGLSRRSSDPNMTVESNLIGVSPKVCKNFKNFDLTSPEDEISITGIDISSDNILANIHDTTKKLQNLTNELNQHHDGDENYKTLINGSSQRLDQNPEYPFLNTEADISCIASSLKHEQDSENTRSFNLDKLHLISALTTDLVEPTKDKENICDEIDAGETNSHATYNKSLNGTTFLESIDLRDTSTSTSTSVSCYSPNNYTTSDCIFYGKDHPEEDEKVEEEKQNTWHGSITTSTDTLVPIEQSTAASLTHSLQNGNSSNSNRTNSVKTNNILPEIHNNMNNSKTVNQWSSFGNSNSMEESILIRPEHENLEISSTGKCETVVNTSNSFGQTQSSSSRRRRISSQSSSSNSNSISKNDYINLKAVNGASATNGILKFSAPGMRSLPLTPSGAGERQQIAISCPDGLAHALSEQNIRLQQIVYEHKMKVDALNRENQGMRLALLKKTCPNCNCLPNANTDEQSSALDNLENVSVCSWEAVEEKSGPSSYASSIQPSNANVLWVPDHAVSRCTICQTEFWLGRRKHHCRSCGQIFCADCSEFWAPLPDERLYNPVRLCGPCYHSVTTRINNMHSRAMNGQFMLNSQINQPVEISSDVQITSPVAANIKSSIPTSSVSTSSSSASPSSINSIDVNLKATSKVVNIGGNSAVACKHAASPPRNVETFKATATSN